MARHGTWLRLALLSACAGGVLRGFTVPAGAQPAAAPEGGKLEEVVVTAQKRTQSLRKVPISVGVVSGKELAQRRVTDFSELQNVTPGLSFDGANTPRGAGIAIRGIGTVSFSDAIEGSVGIVLDGVPIGRQGAGFTDLADLERIEILRGPQGTLFGKNASAGIINIITKAPTSTLTADSGVSYGEHGDFKVHARVSGPVTDDGKIRVSLSGYETQRDGYIHNVINGQDSNNRFEWGLRGKIAADITDDITLLIALDYTQRDVDCCLWTTRTYGSGLYGTGNNVIETAQKRYGITAGPDNLDVAQNGRVYQQQQTHGAAATLTWRLPNDYTLTSISSARSWHEQDNISSSQTPEDLLQINSGNIHQTQQSEELRLNSPAGSRFDLVAGLFAYYEETQDHYLQEGSLGVGDAYPFLGPLLTAPFGRIAQLGVFTTDYAAFADLTYHVTDNFRLFGGVRETHERVHTDFSRNTPAGDLSWAIVEPSSSAPFYGTGNDNKDARSFRAGAQYDVLPNITTYFTAARGYKGAGFEVGLDQNYIRVVQPEVPMSYEVGVKSDLLDHRLVVNADLYHTVFNNYQAQTLVATTGGLVFDTANAGSVLSQGAEVDFTAVPLPGLTVNGGLAYTDARFSDFKVGECYTGQAVNGTGCVQTSPGVYSQDLSGKSLPASPKWNTTFGARYEAPLSDRLRGFAAVNWTWRSATLLAENQDPLSLQKSYSLVDAQFGVVLDRHLTFTVFAKNLFDQRYAESIFDTPFDSGAATSRGGTSQFIPEGAFRTVGAAIDYRY
jgi:iron complex outermembrane receptor protein